MSDDDDGLPFELIDAVLRRSEDVGATARTCSLVCRLWRQASRPHVFHSARITNGARLATLEELVDSDPAIGAAVQEVVVHPYRPPDDTMPNTYPWIADFPVNLPSRLSRVHTLQLVNVCDFGEYMNHTFFHKLAAFSSVERLELRDCTFPEAFLFSIIASLPSLRYLFVGLTYFAVSMLPSPPPQLHQPQLHTLEMDVGNRYSGLFESLLQWVLASPSRISLRRFSVAVHMVHASAVAGLLREAGGWLEELELRLLKFVRARMEYEMIKEDIDLSVCTALRTLILDGVEPACPAILLFLAEVSSPQLRTIVFSFAAQGDPVSLPDFSPLDGALASAHFAGVEEVRFLYNGVPDRQIVEDKLRRELPETNRRGILQLVADPEFRQPVLTRLF